MKTGARVALGVGVGYLLGRTKKMRLALMIASAGATGSLNPLKRGVQQLGELAELGKIAETARGELLAAARTAAVTAVSSRIDSLSERLQHPGAGGQSEEEPSDEDAESVEEDEAADEGQDEESAEDTEDTVEDEEPAEDDEDTEDTEDTAADEEATEDTAEDEEPAPRRRRAPAKQPTSRRRTSARPEEDDEESSPSRRTSTRSRTGRTPVRRTRK